MGSTQFRNPKARGCSVPSEEAQDVDATASGLRVSKLRRSHWSRRLTFLEHSNSRENFTYLVTDFNGTSITDSATMEEFLSSELLQWLQDDNMDIEQGDTIDPEQEQYIDSLLLQASQAYDHETVNGLITPPSAGPANPPPLSSPAPATSPTPSRSRPFAPRRK